MGRVEQNNASQSHLDDILFALEPFDFETTKFLRFGCHLRKLNCSTSLIQPRFKLMVQPKRLKVCLG